MKIILISLVILIIISQLSYSQNNYVGINISPSLTYPNLDTDGINLEGGLNIGFGVDYLYLLSERFSLKTGINYMEKRSTLKDIPDTRVSLSDDNVVYDSYSGTDIEPNKIYYLDHIEVYQSIIVPLALNYKLLTIRQSMISLSAGFDVGYLYNIKNTFDQDKGGKLTWNTKKNNWITSFNLGIGWTQMLSEKFLLLAGPKYSYDFYPDKREVKFNFQTLSIDINCYYQL